MRKRERTRRGEKKQIYIYIYIYKDGRKLEEGNRDNGKRGKETEREKEAIRNGRVANGRTSNGRYRVNSPTPRDLLVTLPHLCVART